MEECRGEGSCWPHWNSDKSVEDKKNALALALTSSTKPGQRDERSENKNKSFDSDSVRQQRVAVLDLEISKAIREKMPDSFTYCEANRTHIFGCCNRTTLHQCPPPPCQEKPTCGKVRCYWAWRKWSKVKSSNKERKSLTSSYQSYILLYFSLLF